MALASQQITLVATTATPLLVQGTTGTKFLVITGDLQDPLPVIIQNTSATTAYIGGPGVTNSNGFPLAQNQSLPMALYGTSEIPYAYSTGTPTLAVLVGRQ